MIVEKEDSLHMSNMILTRLGEKLFERILPKNGSWNDMKIEWIFKYAITNVAGTDLGTSIQKIMNTKKNFGDISGLFKHKKIWIKDTVLYLFQAALHVKLVSHKCKIYIYIQFCCLVLRCLYILSKTDTDFDIICENIIIYQYCRKKILNLLECGLADLYRPYLGRMIIVSFYLYINHVDKYGHSFSLFNTIGSERYIKFLKNRIKNHNNNVNYYIFSNKQDVERLKSGIIKNLKIGVDIENVPLWSDDYMEQIASEIEYMPEKDEKIWETICSDNFENGYSTTIANMLSNNWNL